MNELVGCENIWGETRFYGIGMKFEPFLQCPHLNIIVNADSSPKGKSSLKLVYNSPRILQLRAFK